MSKNVFKVGDVVYHPEKGEGSVLPSNAPGREEEWLINFEKNPSQWIREALLSFSPWPAPDHKRPIQEGWWIVATNGNPCIREKRKESPHHLWEHGAYTGAAISDYEFIRYLGKDWRTAE